MYLGACNPRSASDWVLVQIKKKKRERETQRTNKQAERALGRLFSGATNNFFRINK